MDVIKCTLITWLAHKYPILQVMETGHTKHYYLGGILSVPTILGKAVGGTKF